MPLTTDDVQRILNDAIVQAKLAPVDVAPGLATTLATAILPNLNALIAPTTRTISTVATAAPVMSVTEALSVRDVIAEVVREVQDITATDAEEAAEELLLAGYIDVPSILASVRSPLTDSRPSTGPVPRAVTGSVSVGGGSVGVS